MLKQPKRRKFTKAHKGRISFTIPQNNKFVYGDYALLATEPGIITASQIAATTLAIKRKLKREGKVWFRVYPHVPVSKKGAQVRMGKGKGSIDH